MPEITLNRQTDRPIFLSIKKLVLASKDKERAATGGVRRHAPRETSFLVFLACVAGTWK